MDLDPEGKKRLEELDVELTKLTTKFSENVLDSTNAFEFATENESGLAGLPPSAMTAARERAERKGRAGWLFTLQAPDYTAVMTYLDDPAIRRSRTVRRTPAGGTHRPTRASPFPLRLFAAASSLFCFSFPPPRRSRTPT